MAVKRQAPAALPNRSAAQPTGKAVPQEQAPAEQATGGSFASLFDKTPASSGIGIDVPPGDYECVLVYAKIEPPTEKGVNALLKYEVADEGDYQGKVIPTYYRLQEASGEVGKGMGIFKKDLAKLGFPEVAGADVDDALGQLVEAMDGVAIKVKQNGQYVNAYLQGLVENSEVVEAWKSTRPETPY